MRIKVEPKEFFMYAVFLAFRQGHADPEDEAVKAYLDEHELIPKLQGTDRLDDEDVDVMYYGGCYLGKHLKAIEEIQGDAVKVEMLATEVRRVLQETTDPATRNAADRTDETRMEDLIAGLATQLNEECSFGTSDEGYLKVTLEPDVICGRFTELAAA